MPDKLMSYDQLQQILAQALEKEKGFTSHKEKIVVVVPNAPSTTKSGIILSEPDKKGGDISLGIVISVGAGSHLESGQQIPIQINQGDIVAFNPWPSKTIYKTDDHTYFSVNYNDVYINTNQAQEVKQYGK